jgi:hypothetical protein
MASDSNRLAIHSSPLVGLATVGGSTADCGSAMCGLQVVMNGGTSFRPCLSLGLGLGQVFYLATYLSSGGGMAEFT